MQPRLVLFLECSEGTMQQRILGGPSLYEMSMGPHRIGPSLCTSRSMSQPPELARTIREPMLSIAHTTRTASAPPCDSQVVPRAGPMIPSRS